jgi:putative transposase
MPRNGHRSEQIVTKLRQIEVLVAQGRTIGRACKKAEITEQSYYRWRNWPDGVDGSRTQPWDAVGW